MSKRVGRPPKAGVKKYNISMHEMVHDALKEIAQARGETISKVAERALANYALYPDECLHFFRACQEKEQARFVKEKEDWQKKIQEEKTLAKEEKAKRDKNGILPYF